MDLRKLMVVPVLAGALAVGACAEEEDPVDALPEPGPTPAETGVAPVVVPAAPVATDPVDALPEPGPTPAETGAALEIPGNGIDDDADGLIDEP